MRACRISRFLIERALRALYYHYTALLFLAAVRCHKTALDFCIAEAVCNSILEKRDRALLSPSNHPPARDGRASEFAISHYNTRVTRDDCQISRLPEAYRVAPGVPRE